MRGRENDCHVDVTIVSDCRAHARAGGIPGRSGRTAGMGIKNRGIKLILR